MSLRGPDDTSVSPVDSTIVPLGLTPSSEDFYPTVAIAALMKILRDPSLSTHHTAVVQAVMYIFKTLGLKCAPSLPVIMPPLLGVMRTCPIGMLEFHFQQLGHLVSIVKQHIRNYLSDIFSLIQEYWNPNSNIQTTILSLVEAIAIALDGEFKIYLPTLLPAILSIFEADTSERRLPTQKALHAMIIIGSNLEEYLHLVIPVVVKLFERSDVPINIRKAAIQTVGQLCRKINFSDQASRIIHPIVRVLAGRYTEIKPTAMDTLSALVYQLSSDFAIFVPMVNKVLQKHHITHQKYEMLVNKLLKNERLPQELGIDKEDRYFFFFIGVENCHYCHCHYCHSIRYIRGIFCFSPSLVSFFF